MHQQDHSTRTARFQRTLCVFSRKNSHHDHTGEIALSNWKQDELHMIAETDDLHIAPFREDGQA